MANAKEVVKETLSTETKFSKEQIVASAKYKANRDLLEALLEDNAQYSHSEVQSKLNTYLKKKF